MPVVSVVIPTYNRANTILRSIQSVLRQTYQDFELIIVDDASTDNTEEMVKSINDSRIKYIKHQKNRGGSAARNTGINEAIGNYIAFLDSDDEWLPEKLEKQIKVLNNLSSEWGGVYCGAIIIKNNGVKIKKADKQGDLYDEFLNYNVHIFGGSTLTARKSALDRVGLFDETFSRHQDFEFLLRFLKVSKIAAVTLPLAKIYLHNPPLPERVEVAKYKFLNKFRTDIESQGKWKARKIRGEHWLELSDHFFMAGKFKKGFYYLKKAVLQTPILPPNRYARIIIHLIMGSL